MHLLPGGERGSTLHQVAFAAVVIWLGYQGFVNLSRFDAIDGNLGSLANEININGEKEFRRHLVEILDWNGVRLSPDDIRIVLDRAANQYTVTVPAEWTLDLHFWQFKVATTRELRLGNHPYNPH